MWTENKIFIEQILIENYNFNRSMDSRKNIVLTGGNTGIGLETARGLFGDGHNIIFGSRN